ncbi:hypothetical protein FGF1_40880 [Flavobacteriaceae bacterium GF1]
MNRYTYLFPLLLLYGTMVQAQLDEFSVMGLPTATAAEITAITAASQGALAYASDENRLYLFDGTSWNVMVRQSDPNVYSGFFIVSATGNVTVSGIPFQPRNITFIAHANVESINLNSDNATRNNESGLPNSFGTSNGFARDDSGSITQQNIYIGGSGNSINDISRFASSSHCVGIRYGNQNGDNLGETTVALTAFNSDGFTVNVDSFADGLVVLFTAYN